MPAPAAPTDRNGLSKTVYIGGVGQLYQGDLDVGRVIVERLSKEPLGPDVVVEDLFFGALAVCQRLQDLHPDVLILVGATTRGLQPGQVLRREVAPLVRPPDDLQHAVAEAATGYVSIDLVLEVATAFHALPARTIVFEIEPKTTGPSDTLSPEGDMAVLVAIDMIKLELWARTPAPH